MHVPEAHCARSALVGCSVPRPCRIAWMIAAVSRRRVAACRTSVRAATRKTQQQTAEEAQDLGDGNGAGPRSGSTALDDSAAVEDEVVELEPAASAPNEVRGGEAQLMVPEEAGHSLGEELQRQRRKMQEQQASPGLIEGIIQETALIEWPSLKDAALNTLLVLVLVGGTSVFLFVVNSVLSELSTVVYRL